MRISPEKPTAPAPVSGEKIAISLYERHTNRPMHRLAVQLAAAGPTFSLRDARQAARSVNGSRPSDLQDLITVRVVRPATRRGLYEFTPGVREALLQLPSPDPVVQD